MIFFLRRKFSNLISDQKFSEIFTGSIWALFAQVAYICFTLLTSIIIARLYGAEMLGVISIIQAFMLFTTIVTVIGTNTSILRLIPEHIAKYSVKSAFKVYRKTQFFVCAWALFVSFGLYFALDIMAEKVFGKPQLSFYLMLASGFVVFRSLMELNTQAVRGLRLNKHFAIMRVLPSISILLVLGILFICEAGADSPVYAHLIGWGITAVVGAVIMNSAFRRQMGKDDETHEMSLWEILSISIPMLLAATMSLVIGQTGVVLLGIIRTEAEVGYYSLAVRLATLTAFMLQAINTIAAPKFSDLYHKGELDELFYVAQKSSKLIFWVTCPLLLGLLFLGRPILYHLFGAEYVVAYPAMALLVMGQFVNASSGSCAFFMNMTGHQIQFRNTMLITAVLNVLLNVLLIPSMGIIGAAIAGTVSLCFWNVYLVVYIKRTYGRTTAFFPLRLCCVRLGKH